jgi:hypothetical protein
VAGLDVAADIAEVDGLLPNPCRRNSERGRNGARDQRSELRTKFRELSAPAATFRSTQGSRHGCRARRPGLHRIRRFATLVPGVVAKCTATPGLGHAGLPALPPPPFVISLAAVSGESALTLIGFGYTEAKRNDVRALQLEDHRSFHYLSYRLRRLFSSCKLMPFFSFGNSADLSTRTERSSALHRLASPAGKAMAALRTPDPKRRSAARGCSLLAARSHVCGDWANSTMFRFPFSGQDSCEKIWKHTPLVKHTSKIS